VLASGPEQGGIGACGVVVLAGVVAEIELGEVARQVRPAHVVKGMHNVYLYCGLCAVSLTSTLELWITRGSEMGWSWGNKVEAFKFRTLRDLDRVLDMIRSNDLWCADWQALNDPMEGFYYFEPGTARNDAQRIVNAIRQGKQRRFVCSLSARFEIATQWAYYADEFRGLALQYDLTDLSDGGEVTVDHVRYEPLETTFDIYQDADPERLAELILLTKIDEWQHEREIRIISRREGRLRIPGGVRSVTLGHRMASDVKEVIFSYCSARDVAVYELKVDGRGISRRPFDPELRHPQRRRPRLLV
jgi:hypothetical protein